MAEAESSQHSNSAVGRGVGNFGPYDVGKTIGRGAFAKVKVAEHIQTRQKVALKVISRRLTEANPTLLQKLRRETRILSALHHPNITELFDVFQTERDIILVLEYVSHQDLQTYISANGHICEEVARRMFQQLISALEYCHRHRVAHRDIKAENVMLHGDALDVKLGDFGLSSILYDSSFFQTSCGTLHYSAPEVVSGLLYGLEADVWSAGVLLYAMVFGSLPFDKEDTQEMIHDVKMAHYTFPDQPEVSPGVVDLIKRMLVSNPLHRPTMSDVLDHPWMALKLPSNLLHLREVDIQESMQLGLEYAKEKERQQRSQDADVRAIVANLYREPVEKVAAKIQRGVMKAVIFPPPLAARAAAAPQALDAARSSRCSSSGDPTPASSSRSRKGRNKASEASSGDDGSGPMAGCVSSSGGVTATHKKSSAIPSSSCPVSPSAAVSSAAPAGVSSVLVKAASAMDAMIWPSEVPIPIAKVVLRDRSHDMYVAYKLLHRQKQLREFRSFQQELSSGNIGGGFGLCGSGGSASAFKNRVVLMKECTTLFINNSPGAGVAPTSPGLTLSMSTAYSGSGFLQEDSSLATQQSVTLDRFVELRLSSDELWREGYNHVVTPHLKSASPCYNNNNNGGAGAGMALLPPSTSTQPCSAMSLSLSNPLPPLFGHPATIADTTSISQCTSTTTPPRLVVEPSQTTSRRLPDRLHALRPHHNNMLMESQNTNHSRPTQHHAQRPSPAFPDAETPDAATTTTTKPTPPTEAHLSMHLLKPIEADSGRDNNKDELTLTPHSVLHDGDPPPPLLGSLTGPSFSFSPLQREEMIAVDGEGGDGGGHTGTGQALPPQHERPRAKPPAVEDVDEALRFANSSFLALLDQQRRETNTCWPPHSQHQPFKLLPVQPKQRHAPRLHPAASSQREGTTPLTPSCSGSSYTHAPSPTTPTGQTRFGEFMRNGVLFDASSSRSTLRHVYQALKEEGFLWKVCGPFSLTCIKQPSTRLSVSLYKMSETEQVVDFRISPLCGMPAIDDCVRVVERLRSLSDRLSKARELRLSKRPLNLFE